jgi:nicotinamidase-related amidase
MAANEFYDKVYSPSVNYSGPKLQKGGCCIANDGVTPFPNDNKNNKRKGFRAVAITSISKSYTVKETVRRVAALILPIKNAVTDTVNYISILQSAK